MRRPTLARGTTAAAALALFVPSPAATAQETGTVYVDGRRALDDFQPGTSEGPVSLPAGAREVQIFPADAADGSGQPSSPPPRTCLPGRT
ncbi:DUF4397 domain-containing protein [Pseudonocardia sp. H11422]|uniref:DUF4397 domain-containing protein n=1 Tax=Pseudonocardia sp. H11422 TaxID=2835866 RepID=UPI001BDD112C|nr:DUF4397 domain-containing protein [Pseudonocardia sp. H11422]